jgi:nucleoside-diphosphate-sugar epimerase
MKKNTSKKPLRNLVIGSHGFVGSALCDYLRRKGEEVVGFDLKQHKSQDARTASIPFHEFDRVYFLAWEVGGAKYLYRENTQLHQLNWNIELMRNIMPQLHKSKVPFVFVSSQLAEETDTIYGATKKVGELWTNQIGGACVRLWNVYGAIEENTEKSHVIGDFVDQAIKKGKVEMLTTGEETRQFVHIEDICEGLYHVLDKKLHGKVYDLSSFEWSSVREVADLIGLHTGAKIVPGKHKGSARSIAVVKGRPPGWHPKINLFDGIKKMTDEAKIVYGAKAKKLKIKQYA